MNTVPGLLEGRRALIAGASRGLGAEIARRYLEQGASVMLCARDGTVLEESLRRLGTLARPGQSVTAFAADIADRGQVATLMARTVRELGGVDILVNSAGVAGPIGAIDRVDWDAWVHALGVNLFGTVLLCREVLPHLRKAGRGKIVQLSGGGATQALPGLSAYASSKTAVIRFVETLAEETRGQRIDVNAIAPGMLDTRLLDDFIAAGPEAIGSSLYERSVACKRDGVSPLGRAADLAVFLGSSSSDGITGRLISAAWDDWQTLPERVDELTATDIYTLRRIVPQDRGRNWGPVP